MNSLFRFKSDQIKIKDAERQKRMTKREKWVINRLEPYDLLVLFSCFRTGNFSAFIIRRETE